MLNIAMIKEFGDERRVAIAPSMLQSLSSFSFLIERNAGILALWSDKFYQDAGARILRTSREVMKEADILLCVKRPDDEMVKHLKKGALIVGLLEPWREFRSFSSACEKRQLSLFALEFVPRISRAQNMDALSSQSNLAGYRVVIEAASLTSRIFPMLMTAAGTIPPMHVFVMGTGVAGLQALATAARLGAVTSATDIRLETKEQTESLGGTFVAPKEGDPQSKEWQKERNSMISKHIAKQDIVITTALTLGKSAPKIVNDALLKHMKRGSIIMDMASIQGGNCSRTKPGETVTYEGITIVGKLDYAGDIAQTASQLYSNNLQAVIRFLYPDKHPQLTTDFDDAIIQSSLVMHQGRLANLSEHK